MKYYLSASSNTTYSIELNLKFISTQMCKKRPGVAIILKQNIQIKSIYSTLIPCKVTHGIKKFQFEFSQDLKPFHGSFSI
jgi:hypothetical protein